MFENNTNLRKRIDAIGIQLKFIANIMNVSPSYISKLLSGAIISDDNMARLKTIIKTYEEELKKSGILIKERL